MQIHQNCTICILKSAHAFCSYPKSRVILPSLSTFCSFRNKKRLKGKGILMALYFTFLLLSFLMLVIDWSMEVTWVRENRIGFLGDLCFIEPLPSFKASLAPLGSVTSKGCQWPCLLSRWCSTCALYWLWFSLNFHASWVLRTLCSWGIRMLSVNRVARHGGHAYCMYLSLLLTHGLCFSIWLNLQNTNPKRKALRISICQKRSWRKDGAPRRVEPCVAAQAARPPRSRPCYLTSTSLFTLNPLVWGGAPASFLHRELGTFPLPHSTC